MEQTQVRTFVIKPDPDLCGRRVTFNLDSVWFRKKLTDGINEFEKELGLTHITCQCVPVFYVQSGGIFPETGASGDLSYCKEVLVILTF